MKSFVFFISIIELCLFIFSLCYASVAYSKNKSCFNIKLLLLISIFLIENIIIYVYSYLLSVYGFKSDIVFALFFIINCCYTVLVRTISKDIAKDPIANYEIAVYFLYAGLQLLLIVLNEHKWFFNTTSIVFLYISLRALIIANKKHIAGNIENALLLSSLVLGVLVILEDNFFAGSFPHLYGTLSNAYVMSISLNVLSAVHCVFIIDHCRKYSGMAVTQDCASSETAALNVNHMIEKYKFTSREQDVFRLLLAGKSNKDLAAELFVSIGTVKAHTHNIFTKCGVSSREELLHCIYK